MIQESIITINPNYSCRRNYTDEPKHNKKIDYSYKHKIIQLEHTPLKELSDVELNYVLRDKVVGGQARMVYEIESSRRELIHMIDNLKSSLETGDVDIFDMEYLKSTLMNTMDELYDENRRIDIIDSINKCRVIREKDNEFRL